MNPHDSPLGEALAGVPLGVNHLDGYALDRVLLDHTGHTWEWWTAGGEDFVDDETGIRREDIITLVESVAALKLGGRGLHR